MTFSKSFGESLGIDMAAQPRGLSDTELAGADRALQAEGLRLPTEVLGLLKTANGLEHNGVHFFGLGSGNPDLDLLEVNRERRELFPDEMADRVLIGKSELYYFAHTSTPTPHYERLLRPFLDEDQTYNTLSSLLKSEFSLRGRLGLVVQPPSEARLVN